VFNLVNAMLLQSLPFKDPNTLVWLETIPPDHPNLGSGVMAPDYWAWRKQLTSFEV